MVRDRAFRARWSAAVVDAYAGGEENSEMQRAKRMALLHVISSTVAITDLRVLDEEDGHMRELSADILGQVFVADAAYWLGRSCWVDAEGKAVLPVVR